MLFPLNKFSIVTCSYVLNEPVHKEIFLVPLEQSLCTGFSVANISHKDHLHVVSVCSNVHYTGFIWLLMLLLLFCCCEILSENDHAYHHLNVKQHHHVAF